MFSNTPASDRISALPTARPIASPEATLMGLLHVLEAAVEEARDVGLVQTAEGLGALSRFCLAEFQARHGLQH